MIGIIMTLLAGLFVSGIVFRHQRMLTYIGASLALASGWWLILTFVSRSFWPHLAPHYLYGLGGALLAVIFLPWWRIWKLPYRNGVGSGWRDLMVMAALIPVLLAIFFVWRVNGQMGDSWVWHSFFNGDTATFTSLVAKSFSVSGLVTDNPFGAGVPLEYPTLLHAGMASLFGTSHSLGWIHFLSSMTYIGVFVTVTALFLVFDSIFPDPASLGLRSFGARALPLLGVIYVMALGWDNFIYPQSHFFLFGLWLVCASLFWQGLKLNGGLRAMTLCLASLITCVLIAANAVVGAAALIVALAVFGSLVLDTKNMVSVRLLSLVLVLLFIGIFLGLAPGEPQFGGLQFSYDAASEAMRLVPALGLLFIGLALYENRSSSLLLSVTGLCVLAGITFFFSNRDIVVANASRFLYHALLLAWPLMLLPLVPLQWWFRRYFMHSTRTLAERISGWILMLTFVGLLLLPAVSSVARAEDNLMRQDTQEITSSMVEAVWWLEDHVTPGEVIVASPLPPWYIPFFTGHTLLRAAYEDGAYWLSADDAVLSDLRAAFAGDAKAQEAVMGMGNYLLLTKDERIAWEPLKFQKVFDINAIVIYKLR